MGLGTSKTAVKLLFLDVDGVLNHCKDDGGYDIEKDKLLLLKEIVDATDCRIAISSSWRNNPKELKELENALDSVGLYHVGCTPKLFKRTDEIRLFLTAYAKELKATNHYISHWIAIDDTSLNKWDPKLMKNHFVQTSLIFGLTKEHVRKAIQLLNK